MFSVVIPLYNKELSIRNTIQSVLDQKFTEFEIIVINDGSTDNSLQIVSQIDDPRIRIIDKPNRGVSSARNRGIKEAKFEWIAFLDGDDLWKVNHLEEVAEMMKLFPSEKVFTTSFEYSNGNKLFRHPRTSRIFKIDNYFKEALKESLICSITIVVNKACFDKVGNFNPKLSRGEDLDMWARLAKEYIIIKSSKVTAVYVVETENKLTGSKSIYTKSILSEISLKGLMGDERRYFRRMLRSRIKSDLKDFEFKEIFHIIQKHKMDLIK